MKCLDRRVGDDRDDEFPSLGMDEFQSRLTSLRTGTVKWGTARVEQIFIQKLNERYCIDPEDLWDPTSRFPPSDLEKACEVLRLNGKPLRSLSDFTAFIRAGPWDKRMKTIVFYAQDGMWDASNSWACTLESEYAKMLGITFTEQRVNGSMPKRVTQGNCAHYLFVKSKGTLVATIRNTTKRAYKEAIFRRQPKEKLPSTTRKEGKTSNIPRIMNYETKMYVDDGFPGVVGYCEGHPSLSKPSSVHITDSASTMDDCSSVSTPATPHPILNPGDPRASKQRATVICSTGSTSSTLTGSTSSTLTTGCTEDTSRDAELRLLYLVKANPTWTFHQVQQHLADLNASPMPPPPLVAALNPMLPPPLVAAGSNVVEAERPAQLHPGDTSVASHSVVEGIPHFSGEDGVIAPGPPPPPTAPIALCEITAPAVDASTIPAVVAIPVSALVVAGKKTKKRKVAPAGVSEVCLEDVAFILLYLC